MIVDVCPLLHGQTTKLTPLVEADAAVLFSLLADSELWRYTDNEPPLDPAALAKRYRGLEARCSPDGSKLWLNWAVHAQSSGPLGFVQATVDPADRRAEVAYVIGRDFWRHGYATDAMRALLTFLSDHLEITVVEAGVDERNIASCALLRRLDFAIADDSNPINVRFARTLAGGNKGDHPRPLVTVTPARLHDGVLRRPAAFHKG